MIDKTKKPKLTVIQGKKTSQVPLVIESHPTNYKGFPFITLVQYCQQLLLTIVDNIDNELVKVFVVDMCMAENVDENIVIQTAVEWYEHNKFNYPISIEFSKRGLTPHTSKIYKALNIQYISRIIGPAPKYPLACKANVRKRKKKTVSPTVEISANGNVLTLEEFLK